MSDRREIVRDIEITREKTERERGEDNERKQR